MIVAVVAAFLVAFVVADPSTSDVREASVRKAETLVVGEGLGQWRIGMARVVKPGLVRTVRYPENDHDQGCVSFVPHESDSVVDHYAGVRLAWIRNDRGALLLHGIATTRTGDRTRRGFSIRRSTLAQVRRGFATEIIQSGADLAHWGPDRLGQTMVSVYFRTAYEGGNTLFLWFDKRNLLTGLQTSSSGC